MSFLSGLGNLTELMKNARAMGKRFQEMREQLRQERFTASVGGDLVQVTVNGEGDLLTLSIDPSVVDPSDKELLEDLVVAAVSEAVRKSRTHAREQMNSLSGGIDVSGMLGLS